MPNIPSKYHDIMKGSVVAAAAVGVPGVFVPGIDVAAMSGIWINMIIQVSEKAGKPLNGDKAAKFVAAIGAGVAGYYAGSKLFTMLLHAIPGVGTGAAIGINALLNGVYTYRLCNTLVGQFERSTFNGDDLLDLTITIAPMLLPLPSPSEAGEVIVLIIG